MKKFISLTFSFIMLFNISVGIDLSVFAATNTSGDYTYSVSDDKATITDYSGSETNLEIPSTLDGYTVTWIDSYAFSNCTSLTSVTIPDSITRINDYAFYNCRGLTELTMPCSVDLILVGDWDMYSPFSGCINIKKVTITKGNGTMTNHLLYDMDCTEVVIEDGVTNISSDAFRYCTNLTKITIPSSVQSIGGCAFYSCINLSTITIPSSVQSIGKYAFYNCLNLSTILDENGNSHDVILDDNDTELVLFVNDEITDYTIPSNITKIHEGAFRNRKNLKSVTFNNNITSIGGCAFYGCTGLNAVYINSLENWFNIIFERGNYNDDVYRDYDEVYDNTANPLIYTGNLYLNNKLITDLIIPDSVTSIGNSVFYNCTNLTSVTIPDSVTSIGDSTFHNCTNLTSVAIPDGVTSIGGGAFYNCTSLTNITIPSGVTKIYGGTFYNCINLKSVTILNPDCYIYDSKETFYYADTIYGYKNSTAELYARDYNRTFIDIENIDSINNTTNNSTTKNTTTKQSTTTTAKVTRSASTVAADKAAAQKAMKQAKIKKLTAKSNAKKKITVTWKKVKKAVGYQVQVSTNKKFKKSKIVFNKELKKTKLSIKGKKIKSKKTYYVRVRAYATYKNANGKNIKLYSDWNKKARKVTVQ